MTQSLEELVAQASSDVRQAILSRIQVLPYADLQALNQPGSLNELNNTVISALAVMVAQGPSRPRLLRSDDFGNLRVTQRTNWATVVNQPVNIGDTKIHVTDTSQFLEGDQVTVLPPTFSSPAIVDLTVVAIPDSNTLDFGGQTMDANIPVGGIVRGEPTVNVRTTFEPVQQRGDTIATFPGGAAVVDPGLSFWADPVGRVAGRTDAVRPYDGWLWSGQVNGAAASVTFPAPGAGKRLQLASIKAWTLNSAGAAIDRLQVWKNGFGTGTQLDETLVTNPAANAAFQYDTDKVRIVGDVNGTISVGWSAPPATTAHSVSAGVFTLA